MKMEEDKPKQYNYITLIPSAKRLLNSLRNLRYDFPKAVADVIDNSIQSGATRIDLTMEFEGTNSWLRIIDNGSGMSGDELTEALRLGTKRNYKNNELGKFGMGLKTASLSQCRRLTVASRSSKYNSHIGIRCLDLDEIEKSDSWEILDIPADAGDSRLFESIKNGSGTVVLWELLDKIMNYKIPSGAAASRRFYQMAKELEDHLAMVFHRFLSGESTRAQIEITLNGRRIQPWDPFAMSERTTLRLDKGILDVQGPNEVYTMEYSSFVLPNQEFFSSRESFDYYGRGKWNELQGFYIYREDRLIQYGGWNNLRTPEEHTKFARIGLYFKSDSDNAIDLDIRKSNIDLPQNLKDALKPIVSKVTSVANKLYRTGNFKASKIKKNDREKGTFGTVNSTIEQNTQNPPLNEQDSEIGAEQRVKGKVPNNANEFKDITMDYPKGHHTDNAGNKTVKEHDPYLLGEMILAFLRESAQETGNLEQLELILKNLKDKRPDIAALLGIMGV